MLIKKIGVIFTVLCFTALSIVIAFNIHAQENNRYSVEKRLKPVICMNYGEFNRYAEQGNWHVMMKGAERQNQRTFLFQDRKGSFIVVQNNIKHNLVCMLGALPDVESENWPIGENRFKGSTGEET